MNARRRARVTDLPVRRVERLPEGELDEAAWPATLPPVAQLLAEGLDLGPVTVPRRPAALPAPPRAVALKEETLLPTGPGVTVPRSSPRRRRLVGAALGVVLAAGAAGPAVVGGEAAHAAGRVTYVTPAQVPHGSTGAATLTGRLQALRAGDTLVLRAGVYDVGFTRPLLAKGTAAAPITVIAEDPAHTLIKGQLKFWDADHWRLAYLRVQATQPGAEALWMGGGRGWLVSGGEFFGARATGAYANVAIGSGTPGQPSPRDFRFTASCVHGAGRTARVNQDHDVYVNFAGSAASGGSIDHNVIFDAPNGAGVKLGFGGEPGALGPWNVRIAQNTIVANGRQVLLHGNVRNTVVQGNILGYSTRAFQQDPRTTAIYANLLTTSTNRYLHNHVYASSMVAYDPGHRLRSGGDNALRAAPAFTATNTCSGWRTARPTPYGRYGTARY